jgi:uncharacterized protein
MKTPLTKDQIIAILKERLPALLRDTPVVLAYLYGSVARQETHRWSDTDIALLLAEDAPASYDTLELSLSLSVRLMREAGLTEPDVRIVNEMPLMLRGQIACQGAPVYVRDEDARVEFETRTRDAYFDYRPIAESLRKAYFADIRERGLNAQSRKS